MSDGGHTCWWGTAWILELRPLLQGSGAFTYVRLQGRVPSPATPYRSAPHQHTYRRALGRDESTRGLTLVSTSITPHYAPSRIRLPAELARICTSHGAETRTSRIALSTASILRLPIPPQLRWETYPVQRDWWGRASQVVTDNHSLESAERPKPLPITAD